MVSGCVPQLGDAAGWIPCSGRAAHRASWMDKASDCAMPLGRDVDYAVKLCGIAGWVLDRSPGSGLSSGAALQYV